MPLLREITVWVAVAGFAIVQVLLILRTLHQSTRLSQKLDQRSYPTLTELAWVAAPSAILVLLGFFAFQAVYEG